LPPSRLLRWLILLVPTVWCLLTALQRAVVGSAVRGRKRVAGASPSLLEEVGLRPHLRRPSRPLVLRRLFLFRVRLERVAGAMVLVRRHG
jgi:hypothetical protein